MLIISLSNIQVYNIGFRIMGIQVICFTTFIQNQYPVALFRKLKDA